MSVKGCTFYGNTAGTSGGAIGCSISSSLTLAGNLFYGNTAASGYHVVRPDGTVTSNGYNVVDVPLGTASNQSGWAAHSADKTVGSPTIAATSFKLLSGSGAANVITSRPGGYPTADFYGNPIPASGAAAGAVQAVASGTGYYLSLSVNNSEWGSVSASPAPDSDGLYPAGGSVTLTAASKGPAGYGFLYWLVNDTQQLNSNPNPLTLTLNNNYKVQAVFGRLSANSVRQVLFSGPTETVTLSGLSNNSIYLVKVNTSGLFTVSAANSGGLSPSITGIAPPAPAPDEPQLPRMGHPAAEEFNANPPPIVDTEPRRSRAPFVPPVVGNTRMFWVESYYASGVWVQKQATLRAAGTYGNVWVMDENYGSGGGNNITAAQAQALASKFDLIYPIETNLLGYEYGGGPGGDGGKDGDPKVQILVYAMLNASGGGAGVGGFFWSKDFFEQTQLTSNKTNLAEIFYLDAISVNNYLDFMYSALVHEFQHMINFNVKYVKRGKSSESWYNEMLSMMAEDVVSPLIGVAPTNSYHPIKVRIPAFLDTYNQIGTTEWTSLSSNSYAKGYAFGAYLLRNYGGASLLQEMLANNATNIDSVTAALKTVADSGLSFTEALRRYGEALVYSGTMPADVLSFDKTVAKTIGGYTYTATKFNVWSDFGAAKPRIFGQSEQVEIRPYSITVHQGIGWTNRTGSLSITLQRPNDSNVEFYLMVK
jgi:hypothetical protein